MDAPFAVSVSALWLGLLTSVSPCPLAANIAAMSYVSREVRSRRRTLLAGLLYTLGRASSYAALAALLVGGLLSIPEVALFLQKHMNRILGPLLVAVGLVLLEWIRLPGFGSRIYDRTGDRLGTGLPVVVFAVLVSAGLAWAGSAFHRMQAVERLARRVTAVVVITVGLYYTWTFTVRGASSL